MFLTVPDLPETKDHAFYTARAFLFQISGTYPDSYNFPNKNRGSKFSPEDVKQEISKIYTSIRDRYYSRGADPVKGSGQTRIGTVLRHILAIEGAFLLRFRSRKEFINFCSKINSIADMFPSRKAKFEFEKLSRLRRLPDEGYITNLLFGIPIPIRGATTLFSGGLRLNSDQGLVISIQGHAGAGKTSLAIALATALNPLGFQTLFLTAEETAKDLTGKMHALRPAEIERLTSVGNIGEDIEFINVAEIDDEEDENSELGIIDRTIDILENHSILSKKLRIETNNSEIIHPTKSIIILDGLHDMLASESLSDKEYSDDSYEILRGVVETCKQQNSIVILTSGSEWSNVSNIDYLVDMAISVSNNTVEELNRRPKRQLVINKARHQQCAIGSHGFHIGGSRGFRFSPQANYVLDSLAVFDPYLVDKSLKRSPFSARHHEDRILDNVNSRIEREKNIYQKESTIELYHRSNIFINGRGSGGKAALSLRLAMTPFAEDNLRPSARFPRSRILIVSFLYGEEYYNNIYSEIKNVITVEYPSVSKRQNYYHMPDVLQLYPGYIRPDELFNKLKNTLDGEIYRGEPYTEVILEGIHNVFLQFPELENDVVFWPQIFSLMKQYDVSLITTNTIVVVDDPREIAEQLYVDNRKSEPLRQALVSKTDYYFELNKSKRPSPNEQIDRFELRIMSAVGQGVPSKAIMWHREAMVFMEDL